MNVLSAELGGACGRVSEGVGGGRRTRRRGVCVSARAAGAPRGHGTLRRGPTACVPVRRCAGGAQPCGAPGAPSARRGRGLGAERVTPRRAPACTHARARPASGLRGGGSGTAAPAHRPAAAKRAGREGGLLGFRALQTAGVWAVRGQVGKREVC